MARRRRRPPCTSTQVVATVGDLGLCLRCDAWLHPCPDCGVWLHNHTTEHEAAPGMLCLRESETPHSVETISGGLPTLGKHHR